MAGVDRPRPRCGGTCIARAIPGLQRRHRRRWAPALRAHARRGNLRGRREPRLRQRLASAGRSIARAGGSACRSRRRRAPRTVERPHLTARVRDPSRGKPFSQGESAYGHIRRLCLHRARRPRARGHRYAGALFRAIARARHQSDSSRIPRPPPVYAAGPRVSRRDGDPDDGEGCGKMRGVCR